MTTSTEAAWPDDVSRLSAEAQALWTDATSTSWGRDNGGSFVERLGALTDDDECLLLSRMLMDRHHASYRSLQQVVYERWRRTLPPGERPLAHSEDYSSLVERGEGFRADMAGILARLDSDAERAELLTMWVDDGTHWLNQLRSMRDAAIISCLADGLTPREIARRLDMSKTQIINVRNRYLRDIETVGARSKDVVYRSRDGVVLYLNDALRSHTGLEPQQFVGRPCSELGHPDDYPRFMPLRDAALRRGFGRFRGDLRLRTADGGYRWFDADFKVISDPETGAVDVYAEARPRSQPALAGPGPATATAAAP